MNVVVLWHMHQPYYVNPLTKKAMMPWVRLHAVKGYLDMIDLVTAQPNLRVNFNFTPVLVRQILELVNHEVEDEWESLSRKPAADLNQQERRDLLQNFFKINWETLVRPMPRYAELLDKRGANYTLDHLDAIIRTFTEGDLRDLQVLYNLQWCGFSAARRFPLLQELKSRGRDFTEKEKNSVLDIHHQILGLVLGEYRAAAERGQIELTTTPYFHPIMPLVYDTHIARRCQPLSPLPSSFSAPEDVRAHLRLAQEQHEKVFGRRARGSGPRRGPSAPKSFHSSPKPGSITSARTKAISSKASSKIPRGSTATSTISNFFRAGASTVAAPPSRPSSANALFLISSALTPPATKPAAPSTTSSAISGTSPPSPLPAAVSPRSSSTAKTPGKPSLTAAKTSSLPFIAPWSPRLNYSPAASAITSTPTPPRWKPPSPFRSWIRSDFDIWIGDPEENKAWEWLKETRHFLVERLAKVNVPAQKAEAAWWEIYAAEGSDWFWWYGPDFTIDTDFLFDELFRLHLQNVYRILDIEPPAHLEVPICLPSTELSYSQPLRLLSPDISGETDRYFDWLGAGELDLTKQQTAMFQGDRIGQKLYFGFGPRAFFVRLDLSRHPEAIVLRFLLPHPCRVTLRQNSLGKVEATFEASKDGVVFTPAPIRDLQANWKGSLSVSVPRSLLGIQPGHEFAFFVQLLEGGLQRERFPERGAIEIAAPGKDFESEQWFV